MALASLGTNRLFLGRFDLARSLFEEALTASADPYEPAGGDLVSGGCIAQPYLAQILALQGALDKAAAQVREAAARVHQAGDLTSLVVALSICCGVA
jgi:hypothetical protein